MVLAYPGKTGEEMLLTNTRVEKSKLLNGRYGVLVPVSPGYVTTLKVYMDGNLQYQKDVVGRQ